MMEDIHGFDANFVDADLPDHMKCSVCLMVLKNPLQLADCGHRFCHDCFDSIKQRSLARQEELLCPNDRNIIDDSKVFEDKAVERVILDLKVRCDNCERGCHWIGELRQLQSHLDSNCTINGQQTLFSATLQIEFLSQSLEQYHHENKLKIRRLQDTYQEVATRCLLLNEQSAETNIAQDNVQASVIQLEEQVKISEMKLSRKMKKIEGELENLNAVMGNINDDIQNISKRLFRKIFKIISIFIILFSIVFYKFLPSR